MLRRLFTSGAIALGLATALPAVAQDGPKAPKATIVLVHGAFAESASWNAVSTSLIREGYPVIAVANPLRGVASDAAYVGAVLKTVRGPVVLVGHSYGGLVINGAAVGADNVKALVFVAGFAPEPGETAAQLAGKFPGSTLGPTLAPPVPLPGGDQDLYILQDRFPAQFAADVPNTDALTMAATQRPIAASAFNEPAGQAAWTTVPSWFIYGSLDRNIPAGAHAFMAQRAGARESVAVAGASHVVMISHPEAVADVIRHAAQARPQSR